MVKNLIMTSLTETDSPPYRLRLWQREERNLKKVCTLKFVVRQKDIRTLRCIDKKLSNFNINITCGH